ncbi:MAG: YncE family protein [Alphaproteobacteria bacterium]
MLRQSLFATSALICALACAGAHSAPASDASLYTLTKSIPIGAPDRWDLLDYDQASHRVYIAHGDRVTVVDGQSGALIGDVSGFTGGSHGVVTVPALNIGFSDDGKAGTASSFDLKTLKLAKTVKAEDDADAIAFDPASGHVFVIDSDPGKVTVVDPKTDSVLATIDGGGKLEIGMADGAGKLYVNGEANKEIVRIDTKTNAVDAHWPIPACTSPHGMAIDAQARRVFTTCENNVMLAVDADTGKVVASLPIGSRTDGAAFDPVRKRVFSSNGDGTLTVIQEKTPDTYAVLGNVKTSLGARTMTIDPKTGRLYLVSAEITVNESAAPTDFRNRFKVTPGSAKLLFWDPAS